MNGRVIVSIAVLLGVAAMWWLNERLPSDAIGIAIGLAVGMLAGLPIAALVIAAARRDEEDDWQPTIIVYPLPPTVYADEVTPYSQMFRRVTGLPQLPDRQAGIEALLDGQPLRGDL